MLLRLDTGPVHLSALRGYLAQIISLRKRQSEHREKITKGQYLAVSPFRGAVYRYSVVGEGARFTWSLDAPERRA